MSRRARFFDSCPSWCSLADLQAMAKEVRCVCAQCDATFHRTRNHVINAIDRNSAIFCSPKCLSLSRKVSVDCPQCGKEMLLGRSARGKYCSQECYQKSKRLPVSTNIQGFSFPRGADPLTEEIIHAECQACHQKQSVTRTILSRKSLPRMEELGYYCCVQCKHVLERRENLKHVPGLDLSRLDEKIVGYACHQCKSVQWPSYQAFTRRIRKNPKTTSFLCKNCIDATRQKPRSGGVKSPRALKPLIQEKGSCESCGLTKLWCLVVHHIDGNHSNNDKSNLEVLCQNCHCSRHLKKVEGVWVYRSDALTPRELCDSFAKN